MTSYSENHDIRIAVIGADRRGKISLEAHKPKQGSLLVAACSLEPEKLEIYREKCQGIRFTSNYLDIANAPDIDAVLVCTPDDLHEEHAIACLRGGKDVFLEKPMAITIEGCDRILHEANVSGRKLYTGHNMRFYPVIQKMHDLVQSGAIGEVQAIWCRHFVSYGGDAYFRDWHAERRRTTGLLLQKGAHDIDIIHWLAGSYTSRVIGMGKLSVYDKLPRRSPEEPMPRVRFNRGHWPPESTAGYHPTIDVEDHSMILMQLENGVQANYSQCHYSPDDQRNYTIIGTRGRLENHGDHSTPDHWATIHIWNRRTGYFPEGHEIFRIPHIDGSHGGADPLIIQDFLDYLRGRPSRGATPLDARMSTAVGVLGTKSLRNGNLPLDIPSVAN